MGLKVLIEILLHVLQGTIKNPKSIATELKDLVAVRDELNSLIVAIDPSQVAETAPPQSEGDKITVQVMADKVAMMEMERAALVNKNNELEKQVADLQAAAPKV